MAPRRAYDRSSHGVDHHGASRRGDVHGPAPHDPNAVIRARITERVARCLRAMLVGIARDYERCGKAACARSRRCRGFACEADIADQR